MPLVSFTIVCLLPSSTHRYTAGPIDTESTFHHHSTVFERPESFPVNMKSVDVLLPLTYLLFFSALTSALPYNDYPRGRLPLSADQLAHHGHRRYLTKPYPTATGTGSAGTAAPTGYYPTGNWTQPGASASTFPTSSYSLSSFSTAVSSAVPTSIPTNTSITATSVTSSEIASSSSGGFLRGVNIGSWLILEPWMVPSMFTGAASGAVDQWTYDSTAGASENLQQHWSTWFTEADVQQLSSYGINALRIPIGYWAYDNTNSPFIKGADAYLEQAIGWARTAGMKVWVDCHGNAGSQNGQEHSGHQGDIRWQEESNRNQSISALVTMAEKYGTQAYADVVVGLEVVNEPAISGSNTLATNQQFAVDAYHAIKAVVTNSDLIIITHDSFQGPDKFTSIAESLGDAGGQGTFGVDVHNYQLYTDSDNSLTQPEHISKACGWAAPLQSATQVMPVYVGEWSALTNICVNPDDSTTAGTSCSTEGCQCATSDPSTWNGNLIEQVRRYVEAQLDAYESGDGYFLWSWNGPGGWGFQNGINTGFIPNPVTSRKYPGQCSGS